jgi:hypothetical protein
MRRSGPKLVRHLLHRVPRTTVGHYYHADCATERRISEELGKATTEFLEGMAKV